MKKISIVILVAGNSTRFKHSKSKIYQDLAGLSIIEHVYKVDKKISKENIIFVCNQNNFSELKKIFSEAKFVIQKKQKGTADAIYQAKKYLKNSNVLILFGDVPLVTIKSLKKLILNFYKNNSIGSMIAFKTENPFGYGRVITEGQYISNVVEELNATKIQKKIQLCNSGVLLCNSNLLFANISKISNKNVKKEKYLPDIFNIFNKINKSFSYVVGLEEEMVGVNSIKDLIKIDAIYQKSLKDKIIENGVILIQPDSIRISYDTKIKSRVIIEPHVIFKNSVEIQSDVIIKSHSSLESCKINSNSSIGPSARIRPKTQIGKNVKIGNYVEIKNSKIGNNTSISHLSYIGDSNIGNNVNIGAGTITCNYDGKKKNKTIIENDVFVGSNCSLIAPIKIGAKSTIGAGSVITENIPKNHLALERSEVKILRKKGKK